MSRNPSPDHQQPCVHCGECAHACPEALDPETMFLALLDDAGSKTQRRALDACTECNRCTLVCPSHIPLLDWFRWGKSELAARQRAELARTRFLARNARLERERGTRVAKRDRKPDTATMPAQTISKPEVLAAIARGRAKHVRSSLIAAPPDSPTEGWSKKS